MGDKVWPSVHGYWIVTDRVSMAGNAIASVRLSVRLFLLFFSNRLTFDLGLFKCKFNTKFVGLCYMTRHVGAPYSSQW